MLFLLFLTLVGLSVWLGLRKKFVALTITLVLLVILIGLWVWLGDHVIHVDYF